MQSTEDGDQKFKRNLIPNMVVAFWDLIFGYIWYVYHVPFLLRYQGVNNTMNQIGIKMDKVIAGLHSAF